VPRKLLVLVIGVFLSWESAAWADTNDLLAKLQNAPTISILTFGPGDDAFSKFGHNAVRIQDQERRTDLVYNFGTFSFESRTLVLDFLTGKFRYWLSVTPFPQTLSSYKRANRSIVEQTLNISPLTARDVNEALIENAKPENATYLYDYYWDNCSTRVRDVVDRALKGELEKRFQGEGRLTLRDHTLRLVADDFWLYLGLDIAMGPVIDREIRRYDEMFLPEKLREGIGGVVFSGVHGSRGLTKETKTWHEARNRPALRSAPPERTQDFFKVGAAIGALLTFIGWEAYHRRRRWAEIALPASLALIGLVAGGLGCLFAGLWALTNHEVAFKNENLFQCAPWALGLCIGSYGLFRARLPWIRWVHRLAAGCLAASVLGLVAKLVPTFGQQNERIIALFLPIWLGVFVATHWMNERAMRTVRIRASEAPVLVPLEEETSEEPEKEPDGSPEDEPEEDEEERKHPSTVPPQPAPA
jgi:hypothetical protein